MTEKDKMQQIISNWKQLKTDDDKKAFLEKVKAAVDAKSSDELIAGVKAIGEMAHDLHGEVLQSSGMATPINIFPSDASEARLIEALLDRMGVRYRVG